MRRNHQHPKIRQIRAWAARNERMLEKLAEIALAHVIASALLVGFAVWFDLI